MDQDKQVPTPRLRLSLLILILYLKLDPSPESLLLSGALDASLRPELAPYAFTMHLSHDK